MAQTGYVPYSINSVPNSKIQCQQCYVSNPDGLLSKETVNRLNTKAYELEQKTGIQLAIVAINSIGSADYYEFATKLFNHWGIGNSEKNTGLLFLFVENQRAIKIETGTGIEGILPDATCNRILEEVMFPYFKRGNYDVGFEQGISAITNQVTTQSALEELFLNTNSTRNNLFTFFSTYFIISFIVFVLLLLWITKVMNNLTGDNEHRYHQVELPSAIVSIFGYVFPLPIYFLARWTKNKRKSLREKPMRCSRCDTTMRLLSEQEEDPYLKSSQISEELVKSVDYDVWLCESCHNTKILRYTLSSHFTSCPQCGSLTYKLDHDKILFPATSLAAGEGVKSYSCRHCKFTNRQHYSIPRIIVAPAGGFGRRSGGFGGGISGGGGAGGRF